MLEFIRCCFSLGEYYSANKYAISYILSIICIYTTDIKKVLNWYNILLPKGIVTIEALSKDESAEEAAE